MKKTLTLLAAVAALLLTAVRSGCGDKTATAGDSPKIPKPVATQEVASEPTVAPVEPTVAPVEPAPEPELSLEERAQIAASSMDPAFADPQTWDAAVAAAQAYCGLAAESPDSAFDMWVGLASQNNPTPEQAGIVIGIAVNVYCPEYAYTAPQ